MPWTQTDFGFGAPTGSPVSALLTFDLVINETNPGITLQGTESSAQQYDLREQGGSLYSVINAHWNGTNWVAVNTANPAYGERINLNGNVEIIYSAATTGNITWTVINSTASATGNTTLAAAASLTVSPTGKLISPAIGPAATQQHTLPAVASDTIALLAAIQTLTNKTLTAPKIDKILDTTQGLSVLSFISPASAVNSFEMDSAATGVSPGIFLRGTDANIGVTTNLKGTGAFQIAAGSAGILASLQLKSGGTTSGDGSILQWLNSAGALNAQMFMDSFSGTMRILSGGNLALHSGSTAISTAGQVLLLSGGSASTVNFWGMVPSVTGSGISLRTQGTDANVTGLIQAQGQAAITIAPLATFTTVVSAFTVAPTWNAAAVAFPGALLVNATDTASAAGSLLADFQDSGVSKFKVDKAGNITTAGTAAIVGALTSASATVSGTLQVNDIITQGAKTLTASGSLLSIADTWNAATVVFPGAILLNMTDTASAVGSLLIDLQVGSVSKFKVDKAGNITATNFVTPILALKKGSGAGNYTTTSTVYADVDATNLAFTVTIPSGQKALIAAEGVVSLTNTNIALNIALADGTTTLAETQFIEGTISAGTLNVPFALNYIFVGDGLSHTFKLRWNVGGAITGTMLNSSATLTPMMTFWIGAAS